MATLRYTPSRAKIEGTEIVKIFVRSVWLVFIALALSAVITKPGRS